MGKGPGASSIALLAHEIKEQQIKVVKGLLNTKQGHAVAHLPAVAAQESVSGYQKISAINNLNRQNTGTVHGIHARAGKTVSVTFQFINGNLVGIQRR